MGIFIQVCWRICQLHGIGDGIYLVQNVFLNLGSSHWLLLYDKCANCQTSQIYFVTLIPSIGDLKLVEKPMPMTLAGNDFCNIKANVKVASTENGIIFGNIGKLLGV